MQAARQYNKKILENLKKIGFTRGNVDVCFCMKKSTKVMIYIALYVNDDLMRGNFEAIDETVEQLKKSWLVLQVSESLQDYLSCEI